MPLRRFLVILGILISPVTQAQQVIRLYEGKAPGSENWTWEEAENSTNLFKTRVVYNVSTPTLTAYLPSADLATGTAVVIAPGGGFHTLSIDSEGIDVAKWLNAKGVAAFVLKYRVVHSLTNDPVAELMPKMADKPKLDAENAPVVPLAIADGRRAMEYVRQHARELGIQPNRIGLMGFSAGGTVTMGVGFANSPANRPDFLAPIYPYLGAGAIAQQVVPTDAPPLFVCAATDDQLGLAPHSTKLYSDRSGGPVDCGWQIGRTAYVSERRTRFRNAEAEPAYRYVDRPLRRLAQTERLFRQIETLTPFLKR